MRRAAVPARLTRVSPAWRRGSTSTAAAAAALLLHPDPAPAVWPHSYTHSHTHPFIISSFSHTLYFSLYSLPSLSTRISPFLHHLAPLSFPHPSLLLSPLRPSTQSARPFIYPSVRQGPSRCHN